MHWNVHANQGTKNLIKKQEFISLKEGGMKFLARESH